MNLPYEKIGWEISLDEIKQTSPCLVPLVKGEFEFSVVGERLRCSSNLACEGVNCQNIIRCIQRRLIFKKTSFISKVCKGNVC